MLKYKEIIQDIHLKYNYQILLKHLNNSFDKYLLIVFDNLFFNRNYLFYLLFHSDPLNTFLELVLRQEKEVLNLYEH